MKTVEEVCKVIDVSGLGQFLAVMLDMSVEDVREVVLLARKQQGELVKADAQRWLDHLDELRNQSHEVGMLLLIRMKNQGIDQLTRNMQESCVLARERMDGLRAEIEMMGQLLPVARVRLPGSSFGWSTNVGLAFEIGDAVKRVNGLRDELESVLPVASECGLDEAEKYFKERLAVAEAGLARGEGESVDEAAKALKEECEKGLKLVKKGRHHTLKSYFDLIYSVDEEALVRTIEWVRKHEAKAFGYALRLGVPVPR